LLRTRLIIGLLLTVALVAIPAMAVAATVTVTGSSTGTATAQPTEPAALCDPTAPDSSEELVCDFDIAGTFTLTTLGTGTYTGTTRLDWSIYTGAEPCAEMTGTMVLTTADGTLTLTMADTSRVCETADPDVHTTTMDATITGATGAYVGATGTFTGDGTTTSVDGVVSYSAEQDLSGSVVLPDPTPTPTPTPTASSTVAAPTPTPAVGALPNTALPSNDGSVLATVLAASFVAGVGLVGTRARRLGR
jgi:hypothetical protein